MVPSARDTKRREAKRRAAQEAAEEAARRAAHEQARKSAAEEAPMSGALDDPAGPGSDKSLAQLHSDHDGLIDQSAAPVASSEPPSPPAPTDAGNLEDDDDEGSVDMDDDEADHSLPDDIRKVTPERPRLDEDEDDAVPQETERWAPKTLADTVVDVEKRCRVCGKDLRGHRRYKDERGYLCKDCEREDRIRRVPCAECGRAVTPEALRPWGPISICTRCWVDHQNDPKLRIKRKVNTEKFEMVERQNLLIIAGIALLLLLIILIAQLF